VISYRSGEPLRQIGIATAPEKMPEMSSEPLSVRDTPEKCLPWDREIRKR